MVRRGGRAGKLERQRLDGPPGGLGEVGKEEGKGFGVEGRKGRGGRGRGRGGGGEGCGLVIGWGGWVWDGEGLLSLMGGVQIVGDEGLSEAA